MTDNYVKVSVDPRHLKLSLFLIKNGVDIGPVEFPTKDAGDIAAIILLSAIDAYQRSGKPRPAITGGVDLTLVRPSRLGAGRSHKRGCTVLTFHFGDAEMGFEVPNSHARRFAQQLLAASADETTKQ
jgi:hypothetical protein